MDELMPRAEASDRDRQREVAVRNLRAWYNSIKTRKMPYQPATALWQMDLIRPDGAIGGVFEATIDGARDATARAQALVDELRADPEEFLDAQFKRYMKGKGKGLEGLRARASLPCSLKPAICWRHGYGWSAPRAMPAIALIVCGSGSRRRWCKRRVPRLS
jgi:hypothetical protein